MYDDRTGNHYRRITAAKRACAPVVRIGHILLFRIRFYKSPLMIAALHLLPRPYPAPLTINLAAGRANSSTGNRGRTVDRVYRGAKRERKERLSLAKERKQRIGKVRARTISRAAPS